MSKSRIKTMIIVFFDIRGIVHSHPASAQQSCIACGSGDLSLVHRYWSCRYIRPLIREAFTIIGRPPNLQGWVFGHGLDDDALAILASTKTRIYRTISRRLVANCLHSCRPLRRLPLTPPNRRQRLEWCRARSTWMTEWHRVVFSDESRFCLSSDSRRVRVWRRRGERSNPAAIVERPTVRQRGIMVWGAIAHDSRSPLLRIQGTMTAQRYVDDVLRPVTLPYLQGVPNALYQQDNARPHTARISQQALQDVQMLPWPPYYPDLSPIEHVWDIIGRRLHMPCHSRVQKTNCGKWVLKPMVVDNMTILYKTVLKPMVADNKTILYKTFSHLHT
ncbi:Transposase [Cordylochernes scorpioides]|uniref:Transposase n=1 Tax=Cordylochernes scorpioides TaxID=51811 RepID=A0ABY6KBR7_9ARAC|nr:Transposase [Cordylochernes scorpioides]